jgi:HNH endonuclease
MDIHDVRKLIFERDGNKCYKCPSTTRLTLDHINPKYRFHYHGIDNIITLCWNCNSLKYINILSQDELNEIKEYLNRVNQRFTEEEASEMGNVIKEYYNSPESKHTRKKKEKKIRDWRDLCIPDKNGKINKWSMYRMRN